MKLGGSQAYYKFWMDKFSSEYELPSNFSVTTFGQHDIEPKKQRTQEQIKHIASLWYGKHSKNANDEDFLESVLNEHDIVWRRLFAESGHLITSFYCSLASYAGIGSKKGGVFCFRHIPNNFIKNWNLQSLVKYFFTIRAAWDDNPDWILIAKQKIMEQTCYAYKGDFTSTLKNMGFVARIVAVTRSWRLQELNNFLAKKTGYRITIVNISNKKGRRKACLLQPKAMLVPDRTKKRIISKDHNKDDIVEECKAYNGEIYLHYNEKGLLPFDAFQEAKEMFSCDTLDFSNLIKREESPTLKKKIVVKKEKIEKEEDIPVGLEHLSHFIEENQYSNNIDQKAVANVTHKKVNDESPRKCSSKRKNLEKNQKQRNKSRMNIFLMISLSNQHKLMK